MAMVLRESDRPRKFASKLAEFVQKPAAPTILFLKDQLRVEPMPTGRRVVFAVRSGLPIPIIYTIFSRASDGRLSEEMADYDHIGPFSTDDWVLEITGWKPDTVHLKLGIEPFEFFTDEVSVVL